MPRGRKLNVSANESEKRGNGPLCQPRVRWRLTVLLSTSDLKFRAAFTGKAIVLIDRDDSLVLANQGKTPVRSLLWSRSASASSSHLQSKKAAAIESTCSCAADLLEGDGADREIDHALANYAEPCAR